MSTAISMSYYRKLPYNVLTDMQGVSLFSTQPNALIAAASLPARSIQDMVTLAKAKPGQLGYGTPGNGSSPLGLGPERGLTDQLRKRFPDRVIDPPTALDDSSVIAVTVSSPTATRTSPTSMPARSAGPPSSTSVTMTPVSPATVVGIPFCMAAEAAASSAGQEDGGEPALAIGTSRPCWSWNTTQRSASVVSTAEHDLTVDVQWDLAGAQDPQPGGRVEQANGELIVFSDANSTWEADALRRLVEV